MATLSDLSFPHFPGNRLRRFPGKWGRVASGGLVAASCIPDRGKPGGRFYRQTVAFIDFQSWTISNGRRMPPLRG